jgi:hypothetical protein
MYAAAPAAARVVAVCICFFVAGRYSAAEFEHGNRIVEIIYIFETMGL